MPRNQGLADIKTLADLEVIAAIMPNRPGVRNVDWQTYKTTVDAVEALSGYDLLALLRDDIENAVESGKTIAAPVAALDGPYTSTEGSSLSMSAAGSTDASGGTLTYLWSFGDGATGAGVTLSHTYAEDGGYDVRLIVNSSSGLADTVFTTATVANVAPSIAAIAGATLLPGESYAATGSFTDPGADPWTATVDYGDGSGFTSLTLAGNAGKSFALSHTYASAGSFTLTVRVKDDDVTSTRTATVTVLTPAEGVENAIVLVNALLAHGKVDAGIANSLTSKLGGAKTSLFHETTHAALGKLEAVLNELDALLRGNHVSAADVDALHELVARVIKSIAS
jgi:hypothetical protein